MFAVGRYPTRGGVDPDEQIRRLGAMVCNPRKPLIPLYTDVFNLGTTEEVEEYLDIERFAAREVFVSTPPLSTIEQWVQDYIQRGQWGFAWLLTRLMYLGSLEPTDMNIFQWQGLPGFSRLWIWRDGVLYPTPIGGSVKRILANWFSLSGGFYAPGGEVLDSDVNAFLDDWASPNSPLVKTPWEGGGDAYDILDAVAQSFQDPLAYPRVEASALYQAPQNAQRVGDVWFQGNLPLCRARPYKKGYGGLIPVGTPWDMEWLQNQKEKIPVSLFRLAAMLRHAE